MIRIIDANNYVRKEIETDPTGMSLRTIIGATAGGTLSIFVWDGVNSNARRREIYPAYKGNRKPVAENIYATFDLLKKALKHTCAMQCEVKGYEADDVIAKLVRTSPEDEIEIWSNDMDFLQLSAEFPGRVFCGCNPKVPAEDVVLYKVLVGDPSDNIKGIRGFGKKSWDSLTTEDKALFRRYLNGEDVLDKLPLSKASRKWVEENFDELLSMKTIVEFIDVPAPLVAEALTQGDSNYAAADAVLKEFML